MRVAYLDCFAGIAGDMFLGALLQAGVPLQVLEAAVSTLGVDASLTVKTVDRSGISACKVDVLEKGQPAEGSYETRHPAHTHVAPPEQRTHTHEPMQQQLKTQHLHKGGHAHEHAHAEAEGEHTHTHAEGHTHTHGRSLTAIRALIGAADLHPRVKAMAIETFTLLGHSEARIHNVPVDDIHFHEVGAVDAIVDIVASCAGIHHLAVDRWHASAINVGGGFVECAHGTFPVPAPATADLLRGMPTYSAHLHKELVTPTGAALLRMLQPDFAPQPTMRVEQIGYGAGTRNPEGFPNVLRLSIGELASDNAPHAAGQPSRAASPDSHELQTVTVLETALDDATPQLLAYVAEQALHAGALDVMLTPVTMKKGRPGTLLTVLTEPNKATDLQQLLLRETTTLGVRVHAEQRACLTRRHESVSTPFGDIRIKIGSEGSDERNAQPEFEDCKAAALKHNAPLKQVQNAAQAAWHAHNSAAQSA